MISPGFDTRAFESVLTFPSVFPPCPWEVAGAGNVGLDTAKHTIGHCSDRLSYGKKHLKAASGFLTWKVRGQPRGWSRAKEGQIVGLQKCKHGYFEIANLIIGWLGGRYWTCPAVFQWLLYSQNDVLGTLMIFKSLFENCVAANEASAHQVPRVRHPQKFLKAHWKMVCPSLNQWC